MPDINYVNPQINNILKQEISIQVSLSGFSFIIKSAESQECLLFRNYKFNNLLLVDELIRKVEQIISEDQYLSNSFSKAEVTYISQKSTLVPEEFFDINNLKRYFEFNHTLNELDELHYTLIPSIKAYNVFSLPNYLTNSFYNIFPNVTFKHQASQLIHYGINVAPQSSPVLVSIHSGFFDIAIFENKNLLLYNSFQYTNSLDFIYFFLYPLSQLKIEAGDQAIIIFGEKALQNDITNELKSRVKSISYPKIENTPICKALPDKNKLEFYNLFQ